jgi:dihydroorotase
MNMPKSTTSPFFQKSTPNITYVANLEKPTITSKDIIKVIKNMESVDMLQEIINEAKLKMKSLYQLDQDTEKIEVLEESLENLQDRNESLRVELEELKSNKKRKLVETPEKNVEIELHDVCISVSVRKKYKL